MLEPAYIVKLFEKHCQSLNFKAGEIIFTEGETGKVMYGILEGEIEELVNNKVVETLLAGDVFGEGALVNDSHLRASTAIAKTDCKLADIDKERFMFLIQETPMFALDVIRSYSNRLVSLKHKQ